MKKVILIFSLLALIGCSNRNVKSHDTEHYVFDYINPLEVIEVDGCEYLLGDWGYATVLTHKGNCKNHSTQSQTLEKYGKVITENNKN